MQKIFDDISSFFDIEKTGKWIFYGILIGIVSGLGAALFFYLLEWVKVFFMVYLCGYYAPGAAGEEQIVNLPANREFIRWMLILVPAIGGLLSGIIVYSLAPEAEGHGTDAYVRSFHRLRGMIRARVPFVKTVASILTIGSGGSAGREGPIAQIGAGFGSWLATRLKLSDSERRMMLIAGTAGGIGAIFRSPLGSALFAIEVLYRDDLETEAIIPAIMSSITAYTIFCSIFGFGSLFKTPDFLFHQPLELLNFAVLGFWCVVLGWIYVKVFYGVRELIFNKIKIPPHFKPAIGGLAVGGIIYYFPEVLGGGYGSIQMAIDGQLALQGMLIFAILKIVATSFTISSGGSGGVFAPSLFIGAMLGGAFGVVSQTLWPNLVLQPTAYVLVGMAAFFSGVASVPLAALIMVCEMAGNYGLLAPLMLVCAISYLFTKRFSLYEAQVLNKAESPAHRGEFTVDVLEQIKVKDAYKPSEKIPLVPTNLPLKLLQKSISETDESAFPVINNAGELTGILNLNDVRSVLFEETLSDLVVAEDIKSELVTVSPEEDLHSALRKFITKKYAQIPVVAEDNPNKVLGLLRHEDLITAYNREIIKRKFEEEYVPTY